MKRNREGKARYTRGGSLKLPVALRLTGQLRRPDASAVREDYAYARLQSAVREEYGRLQSTRAAQDETTWQLPPARGH
jgi:hypothetical protein